MPRTAKTCALALVLSLTLITPAPAAVIYAESNPTGDTALPGSYDYTFTAPSAATALAAIEVQGYRTLDGHNCCEDDFSVLLNGALVYRATFDLGGGGTNLVYTAPAGSTYALTPDVDGETTYTGGVADISLPLLLRAGANTLTLGYDSLQPPDGEGYQGFADEGFGINSVTVSTVPLPPAAPLFAIAVLALGSFGYGRRRARAMLAR